MASRLGSISRSRKGDDWSASISDWPVSAPFRRWKSATEITTTSSRPCTVTCCGPSLLTRRTNSLKCALAFCKAQRFGRSPGDPRCGIDRFTIKHLLRLERDAENLHHFLRGSLPRTRSASPRIITFACEACGVVACAPPSALRFSGSYLTQRALVVLTRIGQAFADCDSKKVMNSLDYAFSTLTASPPSAASASATICGALRPASSYCRCGALWSW